MHLQNGEEMKTRSFSVRWNIPCSYHRDDIDPSFSSLQSYALFCHLFQCVLESTGLIQWNICCSCDHIWGSILDFGIANKVNCINFGKEQKKQSYCWIYDQTNWENYSFLVGIKSGEICRYENYPKKCCGHNWNKYVFWFIKIFW